MSTKLTAAFQESMNRARVLGVSIVYYCDQQYVVGEEWFSPPLDTQTVTVLWLAMTRRGRTIAMCS